MRGLRQPRRFPVLHRSAWAGRGRVAVAAGASAILLAWPTAAAPVPRLGAIAGDVTVITRSTARLASAGAYPGRTIDLPASVEATEVTNVVVFLATPPGGARPQPRPAEIRQTREAFVPHLVAVTVGSPVAFPNDDRIFHNVFSLSPGATFDLGTYPRGRSKTRTFDTPGVVKVFCHLHSHMSAIIRVFDHPYFAVPATDGRFTIPGVPAGRYTLTAWHERAGEVTRDVDVAEGGTARVSFALPLTEGR